jgi:hypothetical protein
MCSACLQLGYVYGCGWAAVRRECALQQIHTKQFPQRHLSMRKVMTNFPSHPVSQKGRRRKTRKKKVPLGQTTRVTYRFSLFWKLGTVTSKKRIQQRVKKFKYVQKCSSWTDAKENCFFILKVRHLYNDALQKQVINTNTIFLEKQPQDNYAFFPISKELGASKNSKYSSSCWKILISSNRGLPNSAQQIYLFPVEFQQALLPSVFCAVYMFDWKLRLVKETGSSGHERNPMSV